MLTDANVARGGLNPKGLTAVGNTLYFVGGAHGTQLWKSDGTLAGTTFVTSANEGAASRGNDFSDLTNVGGTLYFTGLDPRAKTQSYLHDQIHPPERF
jgi:ELWxxDGT repeat protein